jgi:TPR repeat protein
MMKAINFFLMFLPIIISASCSKPASQTTYKFVCKANLAKSNGNELNAFKWYQKAANLGDANAMNQLGLMYYYGFYYHGKGIVRNPQKSHRLWEKAINLGNTKAMLSLGHVLLSESDILKGLEWYKKAADLGDTEAMIELGRIYSVGAFNVPVNLEEGKKWYREKAKFYKKAIEVNNLDSEAMCRLAELYANGWCGVLKDSQEAIKWYKKAAELGNIEAMKHLGYLYADGDEGVYRDRAEATHWYKRAAELGDTEAMCSLGNSYDNDLIFDVVDDSDEPSNTDVILGNFDDLNEAIKWYKKAADLGSTEAMKKLGSLYNYHVTDSAYIRDRILNQSMYGDQLLEFRFFILSVYDLLEVIFRRGKTVEWYKKAANLGDTEAMESLGSLYDSIDNKSESIKWYKEAAELGNTEAMKHLANKYIESSIFQNPKEAIKWYKVAVKLGETDAAKSLAEIYTKGEFTPKNLDLAFRYLKQCETPQWWFASAVIELGSQLRKQGDLNGAIKCYKEALAHGDYEEAICKLGLMYSNSNDPKDLKESINCYKKLLEISPYLNHISFSDRSSCNDVHTEPNLNQFLRWYKVVAGSGNTHAMMQLAKIYADGTDDIPKDPEEAIEWYKKAAELGDTQAMYKLGLIHAHPSAGYSLYQ